MYKLIKQKKSLDKMLDHPACELSLLWYRKELNNGNRPLHAPKVQGQGGSPLRAARRTGILGT